jgi:putative hemolysin
LRRPGEPAEKVEAATLSHIAAGGSPASPAAIIAAVSLCAATSAWHLGQPARFRPQQVYCAAMGHGQEERTQRPPCGVVALGALPEADEDLLGDFLGQDLVGEEALCEAEHGTRVAPVASASASGCHLPTPTARTASLAPARSLVTGTCSRQVPGTDDRHGPLRTVPAVRAPEFGRPARVCHRDGSHPVLLRAMQNR